MSQIETQPTEANTRSPWLRDFACNAALAAKRSWQLRHRLWPAVRHPGRWEIWCLPRETARRVAAASTGPDDPHQIERAVRRRVRLGVAWILAVELVVLVWAILASVTATYTGADLLRFFMLAACTALYLVQTQQPEERRRHHDRRTEHIDTSAIWVASGAMLLPPGYALAVLVMIRVLRYPIARKSAASFTLSTAAHASSLLSAHAVMTGSPILTWPEHAALDRELTAQAYDLLILAAALAAYFVAQSLVIGLARAWAWPDVTRIRLLGTRKDNSNFIFALIIAACTAAMGALNTLLIPVALATAFGTTYLAQALADLRATSSKDKKTGLLGCDAFNVAARLQLIEAQAADRTYAMLVLDLDKFKTRWNDRYGHSGGDLVLRAVGTVLKAEVRETDLVGRFGGEEFIILLRDTTTAEAMELAERIRAAVANLKIAGLTELYSGHANNAPTAVAPVGGCTISIGVAVDGDGDYDSLFDAADRAVYQAKNSGRNRVVLADPITSRRPLAVAS